MSSTSPEPSSRPVTPGRELVEGRGERSTTSERATDKMKRGRGGGMLKGLGVTLKHMLKPAVTRQYPHERPDLPPRTRGVIALMDENCTVCMLCSRECPDWCIYIDSHKEKVPPEKEGGRARTRNVLDRFAIDFALCMYCGICIEVCPFDALFWSPEFEYSTYNIREMTHEKERLREWMDTVPPPPQLEEGADQPAEVQAALEKAEKEAAKREPAAAPAAPPEAEAAPAGEAEAKAAPARPAEPEVHIEAGAIDQETFDKLVAEGTSERVARAKAKAVYVRKKKAEARAAQSSSAEGDLAEGSSSAEGDLAEGSSSAGGDLAEGQQEPAAGGPDEVAAPKAAEPDVHVEDAGEIDQETFDKLIAEGKSERIARAKAKATYVRKKKAEMRKAQEEGGE